MLFMFVLYFVEIKTEIFKRLLLQTMIKQELLI